MWISLLIMGSVAVASSSGSLKTELKEQTFKATVQEGFHFNEKAPNSITIDGQTIKPTTLKPRESEFTGLPKTWSTGKAALYICDDAVTFCEPHFIDLKGGGTAAVKATGSSSKNRGLVNHHGFIEEDFNKALDLAKKQKKLLLVDFSARWCPGCLRLENEVFDTKAFKDLTKDFVKLKIDVDRFENIVLSEKFKIRGIPTLLVLDGEQEEIDRIYDYQPPETLARFFGTIKADPTTMRELKAKITEPGVNLRLGKRLLNASRFEESVDVLARVQPTPPELVQAKIELVASQYKTDKGVRDKYIKTLRDAIKQEPSSSRSITWRTSLVGLLDDKAEKKKISDEGVALADSLLADKEKLKVSLKDDLVGEFSSYEPFLIAVYRADLVDSSDQEAEVVTAAWKQTADVGRSLNISPKKVGAALRYLLILTIAKSYDEADKVALAILKHDPNNGDVQRRRLKVLVEQKRFAEAVTLGEKSLKNSYGRNEFWVAESLAKAYIGAKKTKEAKDLLDRYLARTDIEWTNIQSSRKSMEELRKTL